MPGGRARPRRRAGRCGRSSVWPGGAGQVACRGRARAARGGATAHGAPDRRCRSRRRRARRRPRAPSPRATWAQAVGVLAAVWATSSATDVSISWPMPVRTGTGLTAMARATASSSKAARSVRAPPPRTTAMTSGRWVAEHPQGRARPTRAASAPCTRESARSTSKAKPAAPQLVEEVGLRRAALAGDEPDPQRAASGSGQPALARRSPSSSSRREQLGPGDLELAQRVGGVDGGHPQLELPAGPVPVEPAPDPHLGAVGHPHAAAGRGEGGVDRAGFWRLWSITATVAAAPPVPGSQRLK